MFSAYQPSKQVMLLIVDDDFLLREALSLILAGEGYMVAVAENGLAAMERLRSNERPHLILLDLMMPVMNGWQFRNEQQKDPNLAAIPVVVLSAAEDVHTSAAALKAADYLEKPVETGRLLETIRRHCCKVKAGGKSPVGSLNGGN